MAMVQLAASRVARAAAAAQVVRFELSTVEAAAVSVLWQAGMAGARVAAAAAETAEEIREEVREGRAAAATMVATMAAAAAARRA